MCHLNDLELLKNKRKLERQKQKVVKLPNQVNKEHSVIEQLSKKKRTETTRKEAKNESSGFLGNASDQDICNSDEQDDEDDNDEIMAIISGDNLCEDDAVLWVRNIEDENSDVNVSDNEDREESEDESDDEDKAACSMEGCKHEGKPSSNFNWLKCDIQNCKRWYHDVCVDVLGLSSNQLENVHFICPKCFQNCAKSNCDVVGNFFETVRCKVCLCLYHKQCTGIQLSRRQLSSKNNFTCIDCSSF